MRSKVEIKNKVNMGKSTISMSNDAEIIYNLKERKKSIWYGKVSFIRIQLLV